MNRDDITRDEIFRLLRNNRPQFAPLPDSQSPSAELEREALREFGERDRPAVEAIFYARRHVCALTFSVDPLIQVAHGLSQQAMKRAMDRLEGRLIETVSKARGKPRGIRLLPDWENPVALAEDPNLQIQKIYAEALLAHGGARPGILDSYPPFPYLTHPPEVHAILKRILDPLLKPQVQEPPPDADDGSFDDGMSRPSGS